MAIILCGMPGAGKSTIGKTLSTMTKMPFLDTDEIIIQQTGKLLKDILGKDFKKIETNAVKSIPLNFNGIISTGGSVIYSDDAMKHLKKIGKIIYLDVDFNSLLKRITNFNDRGIVIKKNMTFLDLYNERCPLYEKWADIILNNNDFEKTIEMIYSIMMDILPNMYAVI